MGTTTNKEQHFDQDQKLRKSPIKTPQYLSKSSASKIVPSHAATVFLLAKIGLPNPKPAKPDITQIEPADVSRSAPMLNRKTDQQIAITGNWFGNIC